MQNELIENQENLNLFLQPKEETSIIPLENKNLLTADRSELSYMASLMIEAVDDGLADPLDTLIIAKKGKYVFDAIVDGMKGKAKIDDKNYTKHNVNIRQQETGVKYFYDGCNDPIWKELNMQAIEIAEQMKQRQEWLKTLKGETKEYVDEEGEVFNFNPPIYPPAKMGTPSLICTIK